MSELRSISVRMLCRGEKYYIRVRATGMPAVLLHAPTLEAATARLAAIYKAAVRHREADDQPATPPPKEKGAPIPTWPARSSNLNSRTKLT